MALVGDWLKRFILRSFIYLIGIIIVLMVIGGIVFVVARPQINEFINKEIKKYGIELEGWSLGIPAKANLYNVRFPLRNGIVITAQQVSARPPFSVFKGAADFYDVKMVTDGVVVKIPRIYISGIERNEKDTSIKSKILQALMQMSVASIRADDIEVVSTVNDMPATVNIKDFALNDLYKGKISYIGFNGMQTTSNLQKEKLGGSLQSDTISFKDIDVASVYSFLENTLPPNTSVIDVLGPVNLGNVKLDASLADGKQLSVALDRFNTEGFSLRNIEHPSIHQAKDALVVLKDAGSSKEERNRAMHTFFQLLQTVAKVNGSLKNLVVDTSMGKLSIETLDVMPSNWNNVVPEALLVKVDNAILDLKDSSNEKAQILREMGYNQLDLSFIMNSNWNEQDNTININELSFTSKDMGQAKLSGKIINVDDAFFSGDQMQMIVAVSKMALQSFDISLSDYGFFNKVIKWEAPQAGISEAELRDSIKEIAVETPLSLLKNHSDAKAISEVFGRFVDTPGELNLHVTAKENNGLGLLDFMLGQSDLTALFDKINLTATLMVQSN